jgi:L-2-hydroxyglutarate oxidase LhgO
MAELAIAKNPNSLVVLGEKVIAINDKSGHHEVVTVNKVFKTKKMIFCAGSAS